MRLMIALLVALPFFTNAQKLEKNEVDEFTKRTVKETSWKALWETMQSDSYVRVVKYDSTTFIDYRFMDGKVMAIEENADFFIKTETDSIVSLKNLKYTISCKGCGSKGISGGGAEGIQISLPLFPNDLEYLKDHRVVKIRFYTTKGYREFEVPERNQDLIKRELTLVE